MHFDPLAATISAYDRMAPKYSKRWFESNVVESFVESFIEKIPDQATVLDAGCGSGREVSLLSNLGFDCVGIDLSPATVSMARLNVPESSFRVMDFRNIDYPDSLFDASLCIASVHHLFNEDFHAALKSFSRVIRPGGTLGLTIKLGEGFDYDGAGRFNYYRNHAATLEAISNAGFEVEFERVSPGTQSQNWLQVLARNGKAPKHIVADLCSFCQSPFFMSANVSGKLPVAASILWGDSDYYVAVDRAPLSEGHLLICSNSHVLSMYGNSMPLENLVTHKNAIERILYETYQRKPLFLEHGMAVTTESRNPCIEHAHVHAIPLPKELKSKIERVVGSLTTHRDLQSLDQALVGKEYISYEDKRGKIHVKQDNLHDVPSQFFRMVVARDLQDDEYHWSSVAESEPVRQRFHNTLRDLTERLDKEAAEQQIFSNVPEAVKNRLSAGQLPPVTGERSPAARYVLGDLARHLGSKSEIVGQKTLSDLGEELITSDIITKIFEFGRHGTSFIGDDAATIPLSKTDKITVSTDPCPTPVFFEIERKDFRAHGWLAAVISLSDMAASGSRPKSMLLDCEMPEDMLVGDLIDLLDGIKYASDAYRFDIIGGNIREARKLRVATTIIGEPVGRNGFRRSDASHGEGIYVVGNMGHFWAAIIERLQDEILPLDAHSELQRALYYPDPQVNSSILLASSNIVGACMDASDGPTRCFEEIAKQSNVDIEIDWEALRPSQSVEIVAKRSGIDPKMLMLTWGNFELVFTADDEELERRFSGTEFYPSLHRIGHVKKGSGQAKLRKDGHVFRIPNLSSFRFQKSTSLLGGVQSYFEKLKETNL